MERISLHRCAEWSVKSGELRHRSGRYFQVVGTSVTQGPYAGWHRPMIRQHEIGILGFIVAQHAGEVAWLVQAKTEPGNVDGTQLAPTVQATESNQDRVHGGAPTRYLEWFTDASGQAHTEADLLASEQGTRFLGKRNRNMTLLVDSAEAPLDGDAWRWLSGPVMRELLARDFTINTDARSVIAVSPWRLLTDGRRPFSRWSRSAGFEGAIAASFEAPDELAHVLAELQRRRAQAVQPAIEVPLDASVGRAGTSAPSAIDAQITFVEVHTNDREVEHWCQPLLPALDEQQVDLYARRESQVMRFLFRYVSEPGLRNIVELGPTAQSDAGIPQPLPVGFTAGTTRLHTRQSDEGSRFLFNVAHYRIIELPPGTSGEPSDTVWLSLSQVAALVALPGTFTNEARSVISLLLSLA